MANINPDTSTSTTDNKAPYLRGCLGRYSLAQRIQCLTLLAEGFSSAEVRDRTGVAPRSQRAIKKRARDRGYRPEIDKQIKEAYVEVAVALSATKERVR